MDPTRNFKRYFLYSICFHVTILILILLTAERKSIPPPSTTQVTMLRLRGGEAFSRPPVQTQGEPMHPAQPPVPQPKSPEVKPPKPGTPKTPATAKQEPEVRLGKPRKTPPPSPTPKTKPVESPDENKLADALGQIEEELQERERQLHQPSPASPMPGTGSGPGSEFGSPTGVISAQDPGFAQYQSQVRSKIMREWVQTHVGGELEHLRARITVRINASGDVISKSFAKSSGVPSFDNSAMRAVERASPFPPPPALVQAEALREGFIVDFSSRVLGRK